MTILTAVQWKRCPTPNETYVEYVRRMRGIQEYLAVSSHQSGGPNE